MTKDKVWSLLVLLKGLRREFELYEEELTGERYNSPELNKEIYELGMYWLGMSKR